jgi:hypothetical protein
MIINIAHGNACTAQHSMSQHNTTDVLSSTGTCGCILKVNVVLAIINGNAHTLTAQHSTARSWVVRRCR